MKLKPQSCLVITILAILLAAPASVRADAVADWNLIAIQRIAEANPAHPPPVTFIDMAIVQAAIYEPSTGHRTTLQTVSRGDRRRLWLASGGYRQGRA